MDRIPEVTPDKKKKKNYFELFIIGQCHHSTFEIIMNIIES